MMRWAVGIAAVAVVAGLAVAGVHRSHRVRQVRHHELPIVTVVQPARRDMNHEITLTGDVLGIKQTELLAKVPGFLEKIYADRGDFVSQGKLLAMLTYPEQEAAYAKAKANYDLAEANFRRMKKLLEDGVESRQNYDTALATYAAARESLHSEQILYGYREIRAPFSGYIIRRNFDPGHLVSPSDAMPIFVMADVSTVRIFVYVPEVDVGALRTGTRARITSDAYPERAFDGEVIRLSQGLDSATRTMQTEIDIGNPESELKPGMFVRAAVLLGVHRRALTLPAGAIQRDESGSYVFTVADSRVHRVPIKTGLQEDHAIEIISGLQDGSRVVVSGWESLDDNSQVRVADADHRQPAAPIDPH